MRVQMTKNHTVETEEGPHTFEAGKAFDVLDEVGSDMIAAKTAKLIRKTRAEPQTDPKLDALKEAREAREATIRAEREERDAILDAATRADRNVETIADRVDDLPDEVLE